MSRVLFKIGDIKKPELRRRVEAKLCSSSPLRHGSVYSCSEDAGRCPVAGRGRDAAHAKLEAAFRARWEKAGVVTCAKQVVAITWRECLLFSRRARPGVFRVHGGGHGQGRRGGEKNSVSSPVASGLVFRDPW